MEKMQKCPVCASEETTKFLETKDYFLTGKAFEIWECQTCKIRFTTPQPEEKELPKYYQSNEYFSHQTEKKNPVSFLYAQLRQKNIRKKYNLINQYVKRGKILDIGCGTGELLNFFKKQQWDTKGIEPSEKARTFGRKNYHLQIETETKLDQWPEKEFDIISMWHVLEHVPDINKRIDQTKRLLKDNGKIIIALPNPNSWDSKHYHKYWAALDVPRHLYHFTKESLSNLLKNKELKIIKIVPMKMDAYYVSYLSEKYRQKKLPLFRGFIKGWRSNRSARQTGEYSSLIYVIEKATDQKKN